MATQNTAQEPSPAIPYEEEIVATLRAEWQAMNANALFMRGVCFVITLTISGEIARVELRPNVVVPLKKKTR